MLSASKRPSTRFFATALSHLTLRNGFQGDIPFGSGGGAVLNGGRLELHDCLIAGNGTGSGASFGGAIRNASGAVVASRSILRPG